MSIKRILVLAIALLMVLALVPAAALAEGISYEMQEAAGMKRWDDVWAVLDPVEAEMMAAGATRAEVTYAVYKAALNCPLIDEGSISDFDENEFSFTVNGMVGGYNYRVRNYDKAPARANTSAINHVDPTAAASRVSNAKNGPTAGAKDVLLIGPYYGFDSNFTDQYKEESISLAEATGGERIMVSGNNATGPAIASNFNDKAIVIFDSHGNCIASKQTSYLDLHTSTGLTTTDYNNGWAYNGGSFYGIDGRYIQNHHAGTITNTFVWMAICEGMKLAGRGTTGTALLAAGCGAVYGYSQSVTFAGDYEYEATFWNEMKDGATIADAVAVMKETHGIPDPYGDAYPIVMSPDDPFPSNPDGAQVVNCDWEMYPTEPVALETWSLSADSVSIYAGFSETVRFNKVPDNATLYELEWHSENPAVATVEGNNRRVTITGVSAGVTSVYADVKVDGAVIGQAVCSVNVLYTPTLSEAACAPGNVLEFTSTTANYPWATNFLNGEPVAKSGNVGVNNSTSTMQLVLQMQAGEQLRFKWKVSSEQSYDYLKFYVNNSQYGSSLSGETDWATVTYTANSAGTYTFQWRFSKDEYVGDYDDCGYVNDVEYIRNYTPGDIDGNGVVDSIDALMVLRYSMNLAALSASQLQAGDVNGDGVVNSVDAAIILRMSMGLV
ncbi:MAG: hypothetical protein J6P98_07675 [Clostridia bacterium]|nr:hypothetical protein [Clostridia bacterium]